MASRIKKNIGLFVAATVAPMLWIYGVSTTRHTEVLSAPKPDMTANAASRHIDTGRLASLQIPFVKNQGQIPNSHVAFYAQTFGGTAFVTQDGHVTYALSARDHNGTHMAWALRESLIGAAATTVTGAERSEAKINYYAGGAAKSATDIPAFQEVSLGEVYQGIELNLRAHGNNVEKIFRVRPGAKADAIRLKMEGARGLSINHKGELMAATGVGPVAFTKPVAYQDISGDRKYVEVSYVTSGSDYGFKLGAYDSNREVVIDPLLAATYFGTGTAGDAGADSISYATATAIAVDAQGNVYVGGRTVSPAFPVTPGAFDSAYFDDTGDAIWGASGFVSKFDAGLQHLLASTYLHDGAVSALAVSKKDGSIVVGGVTPRDVDAFPTTPGAYKEHTKKLNDVSSNYSHNGFVTHFDAGLKMIASTYLGGDRWWDEVGGVTTDTDGNIYATGWAESTDAPSTPDAFDPTYEDGDPTHNSGVGDAFVSKLTPDLAQLVASTFVGSTGRDGGKAIATDGQYVYITGRVSGDFKTVVDMPGIAERYNAAIAGAYQEDAPGSCDLASSCSSNVFVAKLTKDLKSTTAITLLGGGNFEEGEAIAVGTDGNVYVAGLTQSTDFPVTRGHSLAGNEHDGFVAKFDNNLSHLLASTLVGGGEDDLVSGLALNNQGKVYVTGYTLSRDFPTTTGAFKEGFADADTKDVFVTKLTSDLALETSTQYGGSASEGKVYGNAKPASVAVDSAGNVYLASSTGSTDLQTTEGAHQTNYAGNNSDGYRDAFVAKFDSTLGAGVSPVSASDTPTPQAAPNSTADTSGTTQATTTDQGGSGGGLFHPLMALAVLLLGARRRLQP